MYLKIRMKTKFREVHYRGRSTLRNIVKFYLSYQSALFSQRRARTNDDDHGRQPQIDQNSILAGSAAKGRNWKIIICLLYRHTYVPFSLTKNERKYFWSRSREDRY